MTSRVLYAIAGVLLAVFSVAMMLGGASHPVASRCAGLRVRSQILAGSVSIPVGARSHEVAVSLPGGRTLLVDAACR